MGIYKCALHNLIPTPMFSSALFIASSSRFTVSLLIFKLLIYFDFSLMNGEGYEDMGLILTFGMWHYFFFGIIFPAP